MVVVSSDRKRRAGKRFSDDDILAMLEGKSPTPRATARHTTPELAIEVETLRTPEESPTDQLLPLAPDDITAHFQLAMPVIIERQEASLQLLKSIDQSAKLIAEHTGRLVWAFIIVPKIFAVIYIAWSLLALAIEA